MSADMKLPRWAIILIVIQTIAILYLSLHIPGLKVMPVHMSYADWVGILLTGVAIILTVVTVFIGLLAFIGWKNLDDAVKRESNEYLKRALGKDGELVPLVETLIQKVSTDIINESYDKSWVENDQDEEFDDVGNGK